MKFKIILKAFLFCFLVFTSSSFVAPTKFSEGLGVFSFTAHQKQELICLTNTLWYEAQGESEQGVRAVMSVIYNRKHHKGFPSTFCGVILQHKQFSAFNLDKRLATKRLKPVKALDKQAYTKVEQVAIEAVLGSFRPVVESSVLYYTNIKVKNKWTLKFKCVIVLGNHSFYKE